jgi:hypothetical protein
VVVLSTTPMTHALPVTLPNRDVLCVNAEFISAEGLRMRGRGRASNGADGREMGFDFAVDRSPRSTQDENGGRVK